MITSFPKNRRPILIPLIAAGLNLLPLAWCGRDYLIDIAIGGSFFGLFCFFIARAKGSIVFRIVACACLTAFCWTIAIGMESIPRNPHRKTFIMPLEKQ